MLLYVHTKARHIIHPSSCLWYRADNEDMYARMYVYPHCAEALKL